MADGLWPLTRSRAGYRSCPRSSTSSRLPPAESAHASSGEKGLARERFRLRDFVLVMRKHQVFAAGMQIKAFAQVLHRHGGALDVPARTAAPNRCVPGCLAWLGSFPEREVAGAVLLVFVHIHARAVFHAAEVFLRELAVLGEFGDAEVPRAVFGAVGDAFSSSFAMNSAISGMCSVARTNFSGRSMFREYMSSRNASSYLRVYSWTVFLSRAALRMILSSTSVMFIT